MTRQAKQAKKLRQHKAQEKCFREAHAEQEFGRRRLQELLAESAAADEEQRRAKGAAADGLDNAARTIAVFEPEVRRLAEAVADTESRAAALRADHERGVAEGLEPCRCRLVSLPEDFDAQRQLRARFTDVAALVQLSWCVGLGDHRHEVVEVQEFLEHRLVKEFGSSRMEVAVMEARSGADTVLLVLAQSQLADLESPAAPPRLNVFELLRASLGDPQFATVRFCATGMDFHRRALGIDRMTAIPVPAALAPMLRPYQAAGFRWLASLLRNGLGAVLADDMGLGKTIQAIALLVFLKQEGLLTTPEGLRRPALVVVPPVLIPNWQQEFARWAPRDLLVVHSFYGPKGKRSLPPEQGACVDVVLTSYHTLSRNVRTFVDPEVIGLSCVVLDEAQCIKNHGTQLARAVKEVGQVVGHARVALSGTPIENKTEEMHSLHDFTNPGYLGTREEFVQDFSRPIEQKQDPAARQAAMDLLKRLVDPFQLRRLKTDKSILPDLPDKIDSAYSVELSGAQQQLYEAVQAEFHQTLQASRESAANHQFERRGHIMTMMNKCRLICAHPAALPRKQYPAALAATSLASPDGTSVAESGKCAQLMELMDSILASGQKVVVFATRLRVLDMLQEVIGQRHPAARVLKLSGDTPMADRPGLLATFQESAECPVLLLSIGVGGVGLNLTAASHVVHFDRCYNPAKEAQATDRCHRLGQHRAVCVHTLVTKDTFEERLDEIMRDKTELSSMTVTSGEDWIASYSDEKIKELFMLRPGRPQQTRKRRSIAPADPDVDEVDEEEAVEAAPRGVLPAPRLRPSRRWKRHCLAAGEEQAACSVCWDAPCSHVLMPCGHQCACGECVALLVSCPICRAPIRQHIQVRVSRVGPGSARAGPAPGAETR